MRTVVLRGARVCLRPWVDADLAPFAALNADPEVMRYMTAPLARDESDAFAGRIRTQHEAQGFGLWALDVPDRAGTMAFAGFVGISATLPFSLPLAGIVPEPHEIGWRLARHAWGKGFATEAAMLALRHAFEVLALPQIVSFTALANTASQAVMRRIGLARRGEFDHPRMAEGHPMRHHVLYALDAPTTGTAPR